MSWYCGSHEQTPTRSTPTEPIVAWQSLVCAIASMLASRLRVPTITPFGWPVEPEVYCRKATSPGSAGPHRLTSQAASHASSRAATGVAAAPSVACHFHSAGQRHSASRTAMLQSHCARRYIFVERKRTGSHDCAMRASFCSPSASSFFAPADGIGEAGMMGG